MTAREVRDQPLDLLKTADICDRRRGRRVGTPRNSGDATLRDNGRRNRGPRGLRRRAPRREPPRDSCCTTCGCSWTQTLRCVGTRSSRRGALPAWGGDPYGSEWGVSSPASDPFESLGGLGALRSTRLGRGGVVSALRSDSNESGKGWAGARGRPKRVAKGSGRMRDDSFGSRRGRAGLDRTRLSLGPELLARAPTRASSISPGTAVRCSAPDFGPGPRRALHGFGGVQVTASRRQTTWRKGRVAP